ncbi:hypothetical protein SeMB42_g00118 [Synchytrium endobioticum]|nr:hypothetical protein SeMB42_g00118 [Synchytrium endobioticum]
MMAREATDAFRKRDYVAAICALKQLPSTDPRVTTNLAVAEYYHSLQHHTVTANTIIQLKTTIDKVYTSHHERGSSPASFPSDSSFNGTTQSSLDDDWAVKDHDDAYDDEELDPVNLPSLPSPVSDSALTQYNRACILYYGGQYLQASEVLTPLFEDHIKKLDDYVAIRVLLLLADVWMRLQRGQGVLQIVSHFERVYASHDNLQRQPFPSSNAPVLDQDDDEDVECDDGTGDLAENGASQSDLYIRNSHHRSDFDYSSTPTLTSPTPPNVSSSPPPISPGASRSVTPLVDFEGSETGHMFPTTPMSFRYTIHLLRGRALLLLNRIKFANREFRYAQRIQQEYVHRMASDTLTSADEVRMQVTDVMPWYLQAKGDWLLHHPDRAMRKLDRVKTMQLYPIQTNESEHGVVDARPFSDKYWWNAMGILAGEGGARALALLSFVKAHARNSEHLSTEMNPLLSQFLDESPGILYNAGVELLVSRNAAQAFECFSKVTNLLQSREAHDHSPSRAWLRTGDCCIAHQEKLKEQTGPFSLNNTILVGGFRIAVLTPHCSRTRQDVHDLSPLTYSYAIHCYKNAFLMAKHGLKGSNHANYGLRTVMVAALVGWTYCTLMSSNSSDAFALSQVTLKVLDSELKVSDVLSRNYMQQQRSLVCLYAERAQLDLIRTGDAIAFPESHVSGTADSTNERYTS